MSKTYPQFPDTTFPDAIQPLVEYLDIESADLALYNSYIGFIANELLSIVENAGLMGLPMPEAITKVIDVLKKEPDKKLRQSH